MLAGEYISVEFCQSFLNTGVLKRMGKKRCSYKCLKIHKKTPVPESLFPATSLKEGLWHRRFSVNFEKFLRAFFIRNRYGRLLLIIIKITGILF